MKIDTSKPRLPIDRIDRFKHPFKPVENEPDKPEELLLADKEGEDLDRIVRKLYNSKIRNEIDTWLEMRKK